MIVRTLLLASLVLSFGLAEGAVYHREEAEQLILGNDLVEVRFSAADGSLLRLERKGGRTWIASSASTAAIPFAFSLDTGTSSVWSAAEGARHGPAGHTLVSHDFASGFCQVALTLTWLDAASTRVAVIFVVRISDGSPWIHIDSRIENRRTTGVVTAFWGPILSRLSLPASPTVVWPAIRGEIHRAFSGFLEESYPCPAAMQWFWVGDATEGLYYGVHDTTIRYKQLRFGSDPDLAADKAASVRTWCYVPPSGNFQGPTVVVGPHRGDWHVAAEEYRRFVIASGWDHAPASWVRTLRGWSNLWIKDANQVLQEDYAEIPARLLAVHARKIDLLDVFGWHWNGFDTFYPDYLPLEDAGGDAGLRAAIATAHTRGDRAMLYFNSRIAHPQSAWHEAHPIAANALERGGAAIRESYNGSSFFVECPSSVLWRNALRARVLEAAARGSDGIWVDQLGAADPYLCHASTHGHADPALAFAGNRTLAVELRNAIGAEGIFTCEGALDALGGEVDVFGTLWFHPLGYKAADAPEVLRYTLPGKLVGLKAEGASWGTAEYHSRAFVLGCPLLDDNAGGLGFLAIYDSAPECFYTGRFLDDVGLAVSPEGLLAKLHLAGDGRSLAVAVWNGASGTVAGSVAVDLDPLRFALEGRTPLEVLELPSRRSVPFTWEGGVVRYSANFPGKAGSAHRIEFSDAVPFRRGDTNCDGVLDISDPVATLGYLFLGGVQLACGRAADANGDGELDLSDAVSSLSFLFLGAGAPPAPFPDCGVDTAPGALTCGLPCGCAAGGA